MPPLGAASRASGDAAVFGMCLQATHMVDAPCSSLLCTRVHTTSANTNLNEDIHVCCVEVVVRQRHHRLLRGRPLTQVASASESYLWGRQSQASILCAHHTTTNTPRLTSTLIKLPSAECKVHSPPAAIRTLIGQPQVVPACPYGCLVPYRVGLSIGRNDITTARNILQDQSLMLLQAGAPSTGSNNLHDRVCQRRCARGRLLRRCEDSRV